jgi:hypothetical protein
MTKPTPVPPLHPPADVGEGSLNERIRRVELRLIAREERVWNGLDDLRLRVTHALDPRRFVTPALIGTGIAALAGGAWWAIRRRARESTPATSSTGTANAERPWRVGMASAFSVIALLPWPPLLRTAWPMLPMQWRRRASPDMVGAGLNVGLPVLVRWLASGRGAAARRHERAAAGRQRA